MNYCRTFKPEGLHEVHMNRKSSYIYEGYIEGNAVIYRVFIYYIDDEKGTIFENAEYNTEAICELLIHDIHNNTTEYYQINDFFEFTRAFNWAFLLNAINTWIERFGKDSLLTPLFNPYSVAGLHYMETIM